ncbi:MAG: hypothetical protein DMG23_03905 [Acidobacteria bacterium]|nr:MAG: hypothetical protein DMG23_03905 [Acidobacteriota bacterium]
MGSQIQIRKPDTKGQPRRGIYLVPSLFTVGTLVCGYIAILSTLKMEFDYAAKAIGWGALFDILDGRIARLTHSTSDFGQQFDSLADVITFGVAPAFLAFAWGVRPVEEVFGTQLVQHLRPGAAGVIAGIVHWAKYPVNDWIYESVWLAVVGLLAFLMVSRLRYHTFKTLDLRRRRPYFAIIIIGIVAYAIWAYSEPVLLTLTLTYSLSGPLARLTSRLRPQPHAPEEVHVA